MTDKEKDVKKQSDANDDAAQQEDNGEESDVSENTRRARFDEFKRKQIEDKKVKTLAKVKQRQERKDAVDEELKTALERKAKYMAERERLDAQVKKKRETERAESAYVIEKTVLVPANDDLPDHMWTDQEIAARKALDKAERVKIEAEGKPRPLDEGEKMMMVRREMQQAKFDENAFYDDNPLWFAFETRLRDMMLAMMEPLVRKGLMDTTYVAKVLKQQEVQQMKTDEFEFLLHKVVKNAGNIDEFKSKLVEYECKTIVKEKSLDALIHEARRISGHCDAQYDQMKQERIDYQRERVLQNEKIEMFGIELDVAKTRMEENYEKSIVKMNAAIDDVTEKVDVVTKKLASLQILQENISEKFKTFGTEIEGNAYRVKRLEDRTADLKYRKLNTQEFYDKMREFERDLRGSIDQTEAVRLELASTDKYIQAYQPISNVAEMAMMFQNVLPRRRHRIPLDRYVQQRQQELVDMIEELRNIPLDKQGIVQAPAPPFDRKQSIDSDYIRDGIKMFKQQQAAKAGVKSSGTRKAPSRKEQGKDMIKKLAQTSAVKDLKELMQESKSNGIKSHEIKRKTMMQPQSGKLSMSLMKSKSLHKQFRGSTRVLGGLQGLMVSGDGSPKDIKRRNRADSVVDIEESPATPLDGGQLLPPEPKTALPNMTGLRRQGTMQSVLLELDSQVNDRDDLSEDSDQSGETVLDITPAPVKSMAISSSNKASLRGSMLAASPMQIGETSLGSNPLIQDLLNRLIELEVRLYREDEARKKQEKDDENKEFLGNDGKSERLSTINDDDEDEVGDEANPSAGPKLRRTTGAKRVATVLDIQSDMGQSQSVSQNGSSLDIKAELAKTQPSVPSINAGEQVVDSALREAEPNSQPAAKGKKKGGASRGRKRRQSCKSDILDSKSEMADGEEDVKKVEVARRPKTKGKSQKRKQTKSKAKKEPVPESAEESVVKDKSSLAEEQTKVDAEPVTQKDEKEEVKKEDGEKVAVTSDELKEKKTVKSDEKSVERRKSLKKSRGHSKGDKKTVKEYSRAVTLLEAIQRDIQRPFTSAQLANIQPEGTVEAAGETVNTADQRRSSGKIARSDKELLRAQSTDSADLRMIKVEENRKDLFKGMKDAEDNKDTKLNQAKKELIIRENDSIPVSSGHVSLASPKKQQEGSKRKAKTLRSPKGRGRSAVSRQKSTQVSGQVSVKKELDAPNREQTPGSALEVQPEEAGDESPIIDIQIPDAGEKTVNQSPGDATAGSAKYRKKSSMRVDKVADSSGDVSTSEEFGENGLGDGFDAEDSVRFVTQDQLESVKKELDEVHTANEALRTYISGVQSELWTVRSRISDSFSWHLYQENIKKEEVERKALTERLDRETAEMRALVKTCETQEHHDRKLLYEQIQATNRRIFVCKKELKEDFELFSRVFKEQDSKMSSCLASAQTICRLSELLQDVLLLQGSLIRQDEMDKKGIFLMGVREEERQKGMTNAQIREAQLDRMEAAFGDNEELTLGQLAEKRRREFGSLWSDNGEPPSRLVQLKDTCLSCSDQPAKLVHAFKMACLSYKPSLVPFQGEQLSRDNLIILQDQLLEEISLNKMKAMRTTEKLQAALRKGQEQDASNELRGGPVTAQDRTELINFVANLSENDKDVMRLLEMKDPFKPVTATGSLLPSTVEHKTDGGSTKGRRSSAMSLTEMACMGINEDSVLINQITAHASAKRLEELDRQTQAGLNMVVNAEAQKLKDQAQRRLRNVTASTHQGHALEHNGSKVKIDIIKNSKRDLQRLQVLGLITETQVNSGMLRPLSSAGLPKEPRDLFNDSERGLINAEVRDQADRQYLDLPKRDKNGNVRDPIGTRIDDMRTRDLYENDDTHAEKLKKLARIRQKSGFLYRRGTLAKRGVEQLMLPMVTTPTERPGSGAQFPEQSLFLDPILSHKTQYDQIISNRVRVQKMRQLERSMREPMTPSGSGVRQHMQRFISSPVMRAPPSAFGPLPPDVVPATNWGNYSGRSTVYYKNRANFSSYSPLKQQHMKRVEQLGALERGEQLALAQRLLVTSGVHASSEIFKEGAKKIFAEQIPDGFYGRGGSQTRPGSRSTVNASANMLPMELSKTMAEAIENAGREPTTESPNKINIQEQSQRLKATAMIPSRASKNVTQVTIQRKPSTETISNSLNDDLSNGQVLESVQNRQPQQSAKDQKSSSAAAIS